MKKIMLLLLSLAISSTAVAKDNKGGFEGPGKGATTVEAALKMSDDTPVILVGNIERSLGDEKYLFRDKTGTIVVEIDDDDWNGLTVKPENEVQIKGEVEAKKYRDNQIDVDKISLK